MSLRIRPANLASDRPALIELLSRHLSKDFNSAKFDWLCRRSPHGPARVWVAFDDSSNRIVGSAAAYPRKLWFGSVERSGFVLGDFCIDEKYRSLGPSLQLQRACLGLLQDPSFEFVYDFPSRSMMAIYQRLGMQQCGELVRWAKPLRADEKVRGVVGSQPLAQTIAAFVNPVLARRGSRGDQTCDLEIQTVPCGQEFSKFDRGLRDPSGIRTERSAEYLNWRYFGNSNTQNEILTARRGGKLVGYVVSSRDLKDASIIDLGAMEQPGVVERLLAGAVERLRELGAATVSLNAGSMHPWNPLFARAGFQRREASPIVASVAQGASISIADFATNWSVMRGERDS